MWKGLLILLGSLWIVPLAWASVVCLEQSTGKLLEYQNPGSPGICQANWVTNNPQYGYTADQIEERSVTPQEWAVIREAQIDRPVKEAQQLKESKAREKRTQASKKLQALGLTQEDVDALFP